MGIQFMSTTTTPDLAAFMTTLLGILTGSIVPGITAIANMIIGTPFLSFTVAFLFAGGIIGLFGRVLSRN